MPVKTNNLTRAAGISPSEEILGNVNSQTVRLKKFEKPSDVTGDSDMGYSTGSVITVVAGQYIQTLDGVTYKVAASDASDQDFTTSGSVKLYYKPLHIVEVSQDPPDPPEGQSVIWQSDGTGLGDDGDVLIKITAGGVTKTGTLMDFSGLSP